MSASADEHFLPLNSFFSYEILGKYGRFLAEITIGNRNNALIIMIKVITIKIRKLGHAFSCPTYVSSVRLK